MHKVTMTLVKRERHWSGSARRETRQLEIVETYRIRKGLVDGLKMLADGLNVNGDSGYGIFNIYKEGRWWYAQWALEQWEDSVDVDSPEFGEAMAGHIHADLTTVLNINELGGLAINWRGFD